MPDQVHTILYVTDVDRCASFYRDVLGLPVKEIGNDRAKLDMNGASLLLLKRNDRTVGGVGAVHLALDVDDVEQAYRDLTDKSVVFTTLPAETALGKQATLCDPDGTPIDLIEWAKADSDSVSTRTVVNHILARSPEAMEVLEEHGIRICGGCIILLNGTVQETAEWSGLSAAESAEMVDELNAKVNARA